MGRRLILLEEVIERNIHKLFLNYDIVCTYPFRIMRNADLTIEEWSKPSTPYSFIRKVRSNGPLIA